MLRSGSLRSVLLSAVLVILATMVYFLYNWARFGDPFETGYRFLVNDVYASFLGRRVTEIGLFSSKYFLQNLVYAFFIGSHLSFAGRYFADVQGMDPLGASLLAASPWVVLVLSVKRDFTNVVLFCAILTVGGIMLFYRGNGFVQNNTQRYALDWLPLLLAMMARSPRPEAYAALPVLVTWGIVVNLVGTGLAWLFGMNIPA